MDRGSLLKIAFAALLAGAVAWIYASGAYQELDPATMRVWFRKAGPWGGVLFIGAYACLQPFGVNGLVFLLSAPLIWSPTEAFLLNWAGTVGTGLFSFSSLASSPAIGFSSGCLHAFADSTIDSKRTDSARCSCSV